MKLKKLNPWLIVLGFALLYLSTFIPSNHPLKNSLDFSPLVSSSSAYPSMPSNVVGEVVKRVIDGDTVELSDGTRVRLIGIDSPESGDCFSVESTNALRELIEGKNVALEKDVQELDKYGRTLAYLYVDGTFVNLEMVINGFAKTLTIPPDIKYTDVFITAQTDARERKRGLWQDGVCENPSPTVQGAQSQNGCSIKGNISSGGNIYHVPGQRYYEKTKVEEEKGERWFCSEAEAENAGWRKSKV